MSILKSNSDSQGFESAIPKVHYSEGSLFRKSTIPTNPKPNPKADPNPNPNPNPNLNPNISTVARICTMDFGNSGTLE